MVKIKDRLVGMDNNIPVFVCSRCGKDYAGKHNCIYDKKKGENDGQI